MAPTAHEILKRYWGYDSFRPLQEDIIRAVMAGSDTLALLPTGGGKSLTYQVPALMLSGVTLVVTPLISLMKDQVDNLAHHGIRAALVHSGMTMRERRLAFDKARLGKIKLLYVSPERLGAESFLQELRAIDVSLLAVDEAHCISQWGYDFRPAYLKIAEIRQRLPNVAVLALTASATPEVANDIRRQLDFRPGNSFFSRSFSRDNLNYIVRIVDSKEQKLIQIMGVTTGSAIVYVRSRRKAAMYSQMLVKAGFSAEFYHAGLSTQEKEERQNRWKQGQTRIMVATNAFGMGIDKPDVRTVVHVDLPSSLEEYYQEAGRAGRDGLPAFAVVVATRADKGVLARRLADAFPDRDFIRRVYELACVFCNIPVGSGYQRTYPFDFSLFVSRFKLPEAPTASAMRLLERSGYWEYVEDTDGRSRVMMLCKREELYGIPLPPVEETVLNAVLRLCTGIFADYAYFYEDQVAEAAGLPRQTVYECLISLTRRHVLHYIPPRSTPILYISTGREETRHVVIPKAVYDVQRERLAKRLEAMRDFTYDSGTCRVETLLHYFGQEPEQGACGKCDVCRESRIRVSVPESLESMERMIERIVGSAESTLTVAGLAARLNMDATLIAPAVRALADRRRISLGGDGTISRL